MSNGKAIYTAIAFPALLILAANLAVAQVSAEKAEAAGTKPAVKDAVQPRPVPGKIEAALKDAAQSKPAQGKTQPDVNDAAQNKPASVKDETLAGTPANVFMQKVLHSAIGATVVASSTHTNFPGEGPVEMLVDGDLTTRWSSDYKAPQTITVDLGKVMKIDLIRLHWETASAIKYCVSASPDATEWTSVHLFFMSNTNKPLPRVDEIKLKDVTARALKFDLQGRANDTWGFSLYEIEVQARE